MKNSNQPEIRVLLAAAEQAANSNSIDEALRLFRLCIDEYLRKGLPFRAIAVAKKARTILGPIPKVRNLVIRLYHHIGLHGDALQEYLSAASFLKKDAITIFRDLSDDAFIEILSFIDVLQVKKGDAVIRQSRKGEDIFVILSGMFEVCRDSKRLNVLFQGDVFGEIGFFCKGERTATVRALEKSVLVRFPSKPLREFREKQTSFSNLLEEVYETRIMKKAHEDLGKPIPEFLKSNIVATLKFPKGKEICMDHQNSLAIIKHGVVEIDYDDMLLKRKEYLKAGSIIPFGRGQARANTNVVILLTGLPRENRTA